MLKIVALDVPQQNYSTESIYVDVRLLRRSRKTHKISHADTQNQIRAKAKPERTPDVVQEALKQTAQAIQEEGCDDVNLRLELYEPSLQHTFSTSKL